jgi:hypothetical protein
LFETQQAIFAAAVLKFSLRDGSKSSGLQFQVLDELQLGLREGKVQDIKQGSKLLFFLLQITNFLDFLGDDYISNRVIPLINLYLLQEHSIESNSNTSIPLNLSQDISHISHKIWGNLHQASTIHQNTIRVHGINYVEYLLKHVNNGITLDLAKEMLRQLINGLCDFSPAFDHPFLQNSPNRLTTTDVVDESLNREKQGFVFDFPEISHHLQTQWAKEALEIAWSYILIVILFIKEPLGTMKMIRNTDIGANNQLVKEIFRVGMCTILFAQISSIGIEKLPELLQIIEGLMLGNPAEKERVEALGIVRNMSASALWTALFEAISDPNEVDYARRASCVTWYLELYSQASLAAKSLPKSAQGVQDSFPIKAKL